VGSADAEVLDATVRDDIAREHRIVALDLQGAGIAIGSHRAEHSWFMVAGIADHGDNASGSDQWSRYAAMAAACYLRTMLERAPATGLNAAG
jgi:nucleoside phosphorylase